MFTMEAGASWLLLGHPRGAIPILEKGPSKWLDNSQMRDYVVRQAADCVGMLGTCAYRRRGLVPSSPSTISRPSGASASSAS
jgi:hypothetical protein